MSEAQEPRSIPPEVGQPAPDFQLESVEGRTVNLSDYQGQPLVLWLSRGIFCPLCRRELVLLRRGYPEFQARNAQLVEVGPNVPALAKRAFRQYLSGRDLEFPYLCDPEWGGA